MRGWIAVVLIIGGGMSLGLLAAPGEARAAYSGANGRIAFVRDFDIWTVSPNGAAERRLTFTGNNGSPTWSPDGRQIAFESSRAGSSDIWVMRADGSHQHRVTFGPADQTDPTWSPDGRFIAYSDDRGSTDDLPLAALFKARSTKPFGAPIRLTRPVADWPTGMVDAEPAWSPNGDTLLFTRYAPCVPCDESSGVVLTVPASGGEVGYPDAAIVDSWAPTWAPGGHAYAWTLLDDPFGGAPTVYIDERGTYHPLVTGLDSAEDPAWAPNGRRIALQSAGDHPGWWLWTVRRDGSGARLVVKDATEPDWQPLVG